MTGPLLSNGIIGGYTNWVIAFFVGVAFGFIIEQAGLASGRKITSVFYGRDFAVPKVMFTAIVTSAAGLLLAHSFGLLDLTKVFLPPTYIWSLLVGGLLFGVGMVAAGYCPGTGLVSAATGRLDALFVLAGIFIGSFIFALASPLLWDFFYAGNMGKASLVELSGLPAGAVLLIILAMALGLFLAAGPLERRFNGGATPVTLGTFSASTGYILVAAAALLAMMAGFGTLRVTPGLAVAQTAGEEFKSHYAFMGAKAYGLEAAELEELINAELKPHHLLDLRRSSEFEQGSLPGAQNVRPNDIRSANGIAALPRDRMVVLFDHDGRVAFQLIPLLRANGVDAHALVGGIEGWIIYKSGADTGGFTLVDEGPAPPPAPAAPAPASGGAGGFVDEGC